MGNQIRSLNRLFESGRLRTMELLIALAIALIAFLGLDIAAVTWGADSRPGMADDHLR